MAGGKERFVIAEMNPDRYIPIPEMTVDFDGTACRGHREGKF